MLFGEKRYNTIDWYLKNRFGKKTIKLSIDGGFSCPNRDGTVGERGCIFCSSKGSGDFAGNRLESIDTQIEKMINIYRKKWKDSLYLAYFQNFTNTYDDIENLEKIYYSAINNKNISGICIATRPDCLDEEIINLLSKINRETFLWVELGFQTSNEVTGNFIRRAYNNEVYKQAMEKLNKNSIKTVTHMILNLPGENIEDNLRTLKYIIDCNTWGIKLHMLYIMKGTDLEKYYLKNRFDLMNKEQYIDLLIEIIIRTPKNIVFHRITGDSPKDKLIEPKWTKDKKYILGKLEKRLKERGLYQGIRS